MVVFCTHFIKLVVTEINEAIIMMRVSVILVFLLWHSFLFGQQVYKTFVPPGQSFSVDVPGVMKNGEKKVLTDLGEFRPVSWIYEGKGEDPNHLYLVSYVDYPQGTFHPDSTAMIQEFFQASIDTHVRDLGGDLSYQSESPYNTSAGVMYRATYNQNKHVVKSRILLIGDRFYAIQVYTTSEKSLNSGMNKFLESFRVTK